MSEQDMEIAKTIQQQIGGRRFAAFVGAKDYVAIKNGLQFKVKARAKDGINVVRIVLNDQDTYDVEYGALRGLNYEVKARSEGIYCDQLESDFKNATGLFTSCGLSR